MSGGFTLVDFTVPTRNIPMTHPAADPPLCEDCRSLDLCFFNPMCAGCQDILLDFKTTIPELFAVMRQWVPQTQRNLSSLTREILRRGANVNDIDGLTGLSLLHYACKSGAVGVGNITSATNLVNSLISKGADTSMKCRWTDMNALHYAVYFDAADIVRVLVEHNPSLVMSTCSEFSNGTCLHVAAANFCLEAGKVLLQNGADGSLTDAEGRKPYQVIPEIVPNEHAEVCSELTELLKNAAENPPPRKSKRMQSRSPSSRSSPAHSPYPPPLVITRPSESNANHSKTTGSSVPKSPAPSNNSTISTTSTQYTGYSGSVSSRAQSPQVPASSSSLGTRSAEPPRTSEATMSSLGLRIGDRVVIESSSSKPKQGTIRFGGTTEFHSGQWAGIELDSAIGKNDGSYGGIRYFSCKPKFGLFVPMHRISKERESLVEKRKKKLVKTRDSPSRTTALAMEAQSQALMKNEIQVGERVMMPGDKVGTLRFAGAVKFAPGFWMGVELDNPTGKNDGSVNNVRYFKCRANYGIFVLQSKVKRADGASLHPGGYAKKVSANSTPVSSGAESIDYASGSISMATSGASGSSEAEASSSSPYPSPGTTRKRVGVASTSSSRSGGRSTASSGRSGGSVLSDSSSLDITLAVGMSVFVNKEMGALKFIGTTEFADGVWLGVELRKPAGKNDGSVQGKRYFHCKANHGLFVRPEKATHRGINCAKILPRELSKT